jgi:hypothetical protein
MERHTTYWTKLKSISIEELNSWFKRYKEQKNRPEFSELKEVFEAIEALLAKPKIS